MKHRFRFHTKVDAFFFILKIHNMNRYPTIPEYRRARAAMQHLGMSDAECDDMFALMAIPTQQYEAA